MASKILLKKSTTASTVPTIADLDVGEVAINTEDKRLFTKDSGGSVVEVSTNPSEITTASADITSLTVTGSATVPTPSSDTHAATKAYVDTSVGNVQTILDEIETIYDTFDDRYLGAKATEPTVDNDGNALIAGAMYFNTTASLTYVYTGSAWQVTALNPSDTLLVANNLSDLNNAATALTNLGITKTAEEINNLDTTVGTLTKTFTSGESATITLDQAVSPAPVVSVTKEVAQTGIVSKGGWDVATDGANYDIQDSAYATTLTPSSATANGTFTLGSGSFASTDVGKRITGNGGQAVILNTDGDYVLESEFTDTSVIASGDWSMYALTFDGTDGVTLTQGIDGYAELSEWDYFVSETAKWDTSTLYYDQVVTVSLSTQEANPRGVFFKPDGTKMYMIGISSDAVFEYDLSTPWDITTISLLQSFSVTANDTAPADIFFKPDGTKMYILGTTNDTVFEYNLSTAWDVSTASYSTNSFSVATEEATPTSIFFKPDGSKMYMTGTTSDSVFEYDLSTAWDISTASYSTTSLAVNVQELIPQGVSFKPDGTKMYIIGNSDDINQYTLSTPWDITTATFVDATPLDNTLAAALLLGLFWHPDGDRFYVVTTDPGDLIYEYKLGRVPVSEDTLISGVRFKPDGTKMYTSGNTLDDIFEYDLSTAWDVNTATYVQTLDLGTTDNGVQELFLKPDGTKLFVLGTGNDRVYEYLLSTAWDISTAIYQQQFSVGTQEPNPYALFFKPDGTKMYMSGNGNNSLAVFEYDLSTAWAINTASYTNSYVTGIAAVHAIAFNPEGTTLYLVDNASDVISEYSLSTPWDITTASNTSNSFRVFPNLLTNYTTVTGLDFGENGTKLFAASIMTYETPTTGITTINTGQIVVPTSAYHPTVTKASGQIDTSTWLDINTMTADETLNGGEVYYAVSTDDRTTWAVIDDTDGVRPIVRNNAGTWEINTNSTYGSTTWTAATTNTELDALSEAVNPTIATTTDITAFPASLWTFDQNQSVAAQEDFPTDIFFKPDGTKMYIVGNTGKDVNEYDLSTAWDVSTISFVQNFSVAAQEDAPWGLAFKPDGTKMYVTGSTQTNVFEYDLSVAWDISSASYLQNYTTATFAYAVRFKPDGTKMYTINTGDEVDEYDLSVAWDVSTASFVQDFLVSSVGETFPWGLDFSSDGTTMYVVGTTLDSILIFTLSTAWDISTAVYNTSFSVVSQETGSRGVFVAENPRKIYVVGNTGDDVNQYSTGISFDISLNAMNSTQLNAVTDPNHYTLGDTLDLAIMLYTESAGSIPESDGVSINYDAEALNKGAVLGTDYDFDFPDSTTVRITSNAAQNLKIRVV